MLPLRRRGAVSRVALLKGGRSLERQVSLRSARAGRGRARAPRPRRGGDRRRARPRRPAARRRAPDVAFVALHGRGGEDGTVQELLELVGAPLHGLAARRRASAAWTRCSPSTRCATPGSRRPTSTRSRETAFRELGAAQGAAGDRGAARLPDRRQARRPGLGARDQVRARRPPTSPGALVAAFSYDTKVLLERHVAGRDLAVSVIEGPDGPEALPLVEAIPHDEDFYDFEARYEIGRTDFRCPAEVGDEATRARAGAGARGLPAARLLRLRPRRPDARARRPASSRCSRPTRSPA